MGTNWDYYNFKRICEIGLGYFSIFSIKGGDAGTEEEEEEEDGDISSRRDDLNLPIARFMYIGLYLRVPDGVVYWFRKDLTGAFDDIHYKTRVQSRV